MRRYANADKDEQWYKTSKRQVSLTFYRIVIVVKYELTLIWSALSWLVLLSGPAFVVPAATGGTTHAVPGSSTNHSSTVYHIVVNCYNHQWNPYWDYSLCLPASFLMSSFVFTLIDMSYCKSPVSCNLVSSYIGCLGLSGILLRTAWQNNAFVEAITVSMVSTSLFNVFASWRRLKLWVSTHLWYWDGVQTWLLQHSQHSSSLLTATQCPLWYVTTSHSFM